MIHNVSPKDVFDMSQNQTPILTALGINYPIIYAITHKIGCCEETRFIDLNYISINDIQMSSGKVERLWYIHYQNVEGEYSYAVFEEGITSIRVLPRLNVIKGANGS